MSLRASDPNKKADFRTTMQLNAVLPKTAEVIDGHLYIGGVDMVKLAQDCGTALYVYDEEDIRSRMTQYRECFRKRYANFDALYASKAFATKEMLRIVKDENLCLDISGGGEFALAQAVDFPTDRIFAHGNNKTPQELREAMSAGIGYIVIDSRIELGRISKIAQELGITQKILMRITPGIEADTHAYIMTGCEDSKFGFTMRNDFAFNCVADVLATPNVSLEGFHCHIGSQIFALHSFEQAVQVMVEFVSRVKEQYGLTTNVLDMGGGLGAAYVAEEQPASIDELAECLCGAVIEACDKFGVQQPRLLVEPGRSLVASPGVTLYTVGILKTLPGIRKYVAIDGGMSDNIRTALYNVDYEATIANKADQPRTEIVTLGGKHCESGDVVIIDGSLQQADLGDIVCVFGTGAYCYSMASNYNGQPRPAVVFVRDGKARVTTRRETYAEVMSRDL